MDPTLEAIVKALPFFHQAFFGEVLFSVVDGEKVVAYLPGELDLGIKVGGPFVRNSAAWDAYHTGTDQFREVAQEQSAFGVPYIVNAVPVRNDSGMIVGAMAVVMSTDRKEKARGVSEELHAMLRQVGASAETISASLESLAASNQEISNRTGLAKKLADDSGNVVELVERLANQTRMLALNGAILAARAGGEHGRAFGVLVGEIRRLAQDSSEAAGRIRDTLRDIQAAVGDAALLTSEVSEAANSQAATLSQLVASIEELGAASEEVNQLMASLSKVI